MGLMATEDENRRDRHKGRALQLRIHPKLRRQLELLCEENVSTLTAEITVAIRNHLAAAGKWPPLATDPRE